MCVSVSVCVLKNTTQKYHAALPERWLDLLRTPTIPCGLDGGSFPGGNRVVSCCRRGLVAHYEKTTFYVGTCVFIILLKI